MPIRLKLQQKLTILVSVPLLFGLLFTALLFSLLQQADHQIRQEQRSKSLITGAKLLTLYIDDALFFMAGYCVTHKKDTLDRFNSAVSDIQSTQSEMRNLVEGNNIEQKTLSRVDNRVAELLDLFAQTKFGTDHLQGGDPDHALAFSLYAKMQKNRLLLRNELNSLTSDALKLQQNYKKDDARAAINTVLITGTLLNILLTIALSVYLGRSFGRRLNLLTGNAVRLAAGEKLLGTSSGDDEIATLDKVFHSMAATLAEASRKERATIDNAIDVICSIDEDGKFTSINAAATTGWGYEADELIGRRYFEIICPEELVKVREIIETTIANQNTCAFETTVIRKDRQKASLAWTARWSESEKSLFCIVHDITERKHAEDLKKEIEEMKQDFLAMVSHDLRTPLGAIQATLTLVDEGVYGTLNEKGVARIKGTQKSVKRLTNLVNNLLDLEKMESGQLIIVKTPTSLSEIIYQSVETVRPYAEQQRVILQVEAKDGMICADLDRMVQVIVNLLSNAIKFSKIDAVVQIAATCGSEYAEIQITDQGRGIPATMHTLVFEKFKQVEEFDGRRGKGTGLGLPICKAIVDAHGGEIGVDSTEGAGSTFWLKIPTQSHV